MIGHWLAAFLRSQNHPQAVGFPPPPGSEKKCRSPLSEIQGAQSLRIADAGCRVAPYLSPRRTEVRGRQGRAPQAANGVGRKIGRARQRGAGVLCRGTCELAENLHGASVVRKRLLLFVTFKNALMFVSTKTYGQSSSHLLVGGGVFTPRTVDTSRGQTHEGGCVRLFVACGAFLFMCGAA